MINYKFEVMVFSKRNEKIRFCIGGQCNNAVSEFEVWLGEKKCEDLRVLFKPAGYIAARGRAGKNRFSVIGEASVKELKCGLKFVLKAGKESSQCFIPYRRISRMAGRQPICYAVDHVHIEKGIVVIKGWAVSLFDEELDYQILNGKTENLKIGKKQREDVQTLFQIGRERPIGFQIEWKAGGKKSCNLEISSESALVKIPIKVNELEQEAGGQSSLYLRVKGRIRKFPGRLASGMKYLLKHGCRETLQRWKQSSADETEQYEKWRLEHKVSREELEKQRKTHFPFEPLFSIVVPLYNTPEVYLFQMIESVQRQTYGRWELCLADGSTDASVEKAVQSYLNDKRIRYKKLEKNGGIAENTNQALAMAGGDFVGFLDHDDMLAENALYEAAARINEEPLADVIYSDEDKISEDSSHYSEPYFKPDFNLDLLRSNNYICHFLVIRKELIRQVGGFDSNLDGSQDHDYIFRCVEKADRIIHIPAILYHWRIHPNSTAGAAANKDYCEDAGKRAIEAHLKRVNTAGTVYPLEAAGFYRVEYEISDQPLVSILIPNRNEKESLKKCIDSIIEKTLYSNYEIIVIENNSTEEEIFLYYEELKKQDRIKVVYWKKKFNYSAINNFGAEQAEGDYYLLLNNDTEVINPGWLSNMLGDCQRPEVGIVGAMLYYPDDTIQHAGVVLGIGGIAGHAFKTFPRDYTGHFMRSGLQQDMSAVTAACMMVKKSVFQEAGGLEEDLEVAFNDIDFCLKVRELGYLIVFEPGAELYHYESKSRGAEDTPEKIERFHRESAYIADKWRTVLEEGDPYYNRNLTLEREDLSLDMGAVF